MILHNVILAMFWMQSAVPLKILNAIRTLLAFLGAEVLAESCWHVPGGIFSDR